jgi:hypothetical protein
MRTVRTRVTLTLGALLMMMVSMSSRAGAATAPNLDSAGSFAVLAGSTVTNTGPTVISGDLGVSPGSAVTGFPPGIVNPPGTIHRADAVAARAKYDLNIAYNNLAGEACDQNLTDQDLGGLTLVPGTYCFDTSAQLTGALTLNAQGNPDSVFVFKIGSTLTTASNSSVGFINGQSCNVYWQIGSSATLGTTTQFQGSILALTSITANTQATVEGRLLAQNGAVTLDSNTVTRPSCGTPVPGPTPNPAQGSSANPTPTETPAAVPPSGSTVIGPDTVIPAGTVISPESIVFPNVPGATPTTTGTPTSSANPSPVGQAITLTAGVNPSGSGSGVPSGLVTFISDSTVLGTVRVDGRGTATFTTSSLTAGNHSIIAVYHGGPGFAGSISRVLVQMVQQAPSGSSTDTPRAELPGTGNNALPLGLSGSGLILLGAGLLVEDRRRAKRGNPAWLWGLKEHFKRTFLLGGPSR